MRVVIIAGLLLCACGTLFSHLPDAGSDAGGGGGGAGGGDSTGGGQASGGGAAAGGGAATGGGGTSTGGGAALGGGTAAGGGGMAGGGSPDAGSVDMGDGGAFTWFELIDNSQINTFHTFLGVRAFAADDVWIVGTEATYGALVARFDGMSIDGVYSTGPAGDIFSDIELIRSPQRLAVAQDNLIVECDRADGGCLDANHWTPRAAGQLGDRVVGLCTDGQRFFGSGDTVSNDGALFGNGRLATFAGSGRLNDCLVQPDGVVLGVGVGKLARYFPDGGSDLLDVAPSGLSGATSEQWFTLHGAGGRVFLAGDGKIIVELMPDGGFELRQQPTVGAGSLRAMAGLLTTELFAAGDSYNDPHAAFFDGSTWSTYPALAPHVQVYGLHAANVNEYFAAGQELNSIGGILGAQLIYGRR